MLSNSRAQMPATSQKIETLRWIGDERGHLVLIDQTKLPAELVDLECRNVEAVWEAIKQLRVRGAPAIGIAAAYGAVLGMQSQRHVQSIEFHAALDQVTDYLAKSRPTAVNLFWALDRMKAKGHSLPGSLAAAEQLAALLAEARAIHEEDRAICHAIGRYGAELLKDQSGVLTHCNAGGLATGGYGSAVGALRTAWQRGVLERVWVDETRPLLQGSRLTAWELESAGIPHAVIADSAAASLMAAGDVDCVVTGADRIAANGDTANKIGTYSLAVLAAHHDIPLYVVAPTSTVDLATPTGSDIPIEERAAAEITSRFPARNPAFDVTPAELIGAIVTEHGVHRAPYAQSLSALV